MYLYVYSIYINKTLSWTASIVGIKFSNITYFLSIVRQLLRNCRPKPFLLLLYKESHQCALLE
jgi:hypothetical protein